MSAAAKHRDAIVQSAVALFRKQGYAGTGLSDILGASGAPKGSLYYYFPNGKISIGVAAIEFAGTRSRRRWRSWRANLTRLPA
jgi:TetR/AcrR family transcriptional repressor of lmrAB and yxaGH operons